MNRVIVTAPQDKTFEALSDSHNRGEHAISAESPFVSKKTVMEWMYACQALVVYGDKKSDLIEHALKLGIPVKFRGLDGTVEDNQDAS